MNCVQFENEEKYVKDFIKLSKKIYGKTCCEDAKEIKSLLQGTHPLSKYFKLYKFLIYEENEVVGRFAITIYPEDDTAYFGFFECINQKEVAKCIFDSARKFAKEHHFQKLIGPVNASFWLKYRLKINLFELEPYTGEPYNKEYYYQMFLDNGYHVAEHYTSNRYKSIDESYQNELFSSRYQTFIEQGYRIENLNMDNFENELKELYRLLSELYSDFPIYKPVSQEDFSLVFRSYKKIMNPEMTKFAYFNNKMVGFYVSVPNYHDLVDNVNLPKLIKILSLKKKPKEYVMLYMGVDQNHRGLGKAIVYSIMTELIKSKLPSIGALARDGKVTQNYAEELIEQRYEYVLLEENLND